MKFTLKSFITPVVVTRIANLHYFEFTNRYHTKSDFHNFCELLYVDRGEITVNAENYSGKVADNQVIIHRPNEILGFNSVHYFSRQFKQITGQSPTEYIKSIRSKFD